MNVGNLELYQIIILILAVSMSIQGVNNFLQRKGQETLLKLGVRLIVWGGMAIIVLFPDFSNVLANMIGIQGNINAVILTGFILVFLMVFKLLAAIERVEQQITILTRKETLKEIDSLTKDKE